MKTHTKTRIFAFSGKSNSGKTTLICKLCEYIKKHLGLKVAVIKHDPKDKALFDIEGKDSAKFFSSSSAVALVSPTRTTIQIHNESLKHTRTHNMLDSVNKHTMWAFDCVMEHFAHYDFVFIEGLKTLPYPRIVVARGHIDESYIAYANSFAIDDSVDNIDILPKSMPVLNLNDIAQIANFICEYGDKTYICARSKNG